MNLTKVNLALAIAAAALAVPTWLTIAADQETFVDVALVPLLFEGFTPDQVASLVMGEPKKEQPPPPANADPNKKQPVQYDSLVVQRTDQGFVLGQGMGDLTGARANAEMLDLQVWKHLGAIRADKDALVQPAATDEQLVEYGLDELHAFVLKAANAQGDVLAELLVGKEASATPGAVDTVRGVFVRRGDSRDIVLYEVPYWTRSTKTDIWLDRTVLKVQADTVRKFRVANATGQATFVRPAGKAAWEAESGPPDVGAVRQIEIEGLVQRCAFLQATQVVRALATANLKTMGLDPAGLEFAITTEKDGQETTVTVGIGALVEGKNEHYVRSSASHFVMTLAAHATTPFERALTEFFDPKALPVDPGKDEEGQPKDDAPKDGPPKEEKAAAPPDAPKQDAVPEQPKTQPDQPKVEPKQEQPKDAPKPEQPKAQPEQPTTPAEQPKTPAQPPKDAPKQEQPAPTASEKGVPK